MSNWKLLKNATSSGCDSASFRRMAALMLSAAGSLIGLQFGGLIAPVLDMQRTQLRHGLVAFWILPSLCFLLLFPILPLLSRRKERVL